MTRETVPMDYAYCGTTNFIPSRKILRIAELVEQVKKGSREPVVRKRAFELARDIYNAPLNIKEMGDDTRLAIAETIFVWVRDSIAYINDPAGDFFQPAVKTIAVGAGDCDDQSILLAAMLGSIGFDPILVILPDHVYVELQEGEKQVPMDPTASNTAFGTLSASMKAHFNEKYGLKFDDYLRIPIAHHVTVTATKQVVKTKTPLQMAMYLEEKAAASYNKGDFYTAEQRFVKAAKMYHDAGLHADSSDAREGLLASSKFCLGWAHLMQALHLVLNKKQDELYLLQSAINQAQSCFGICKPHFEMHGAAAIAREVDALESVLEGYQETLLADFLVHIGDRDASARHYAQARESYREARTKTELSGLKSHIEQSLDSLSHYEVASQKTEHGVGAATEKITDDENLSEQFDIAPEELRMIQERLVNATGERLRNELVTLSVETGIPISVLEAIHGRAVEIVLRVDHPHPRDRYGNAVRVHPVVMAQLGLRKIDRARIIAGKKEHIVTVQPLDANEDLKAIKMNKMVRDMIGVEVGDTVELRRVSSWGRL